MADAQEQGQAAEQVVEEGSLLDQIVSTTKMGPEDESYSIAKRGLQAFMAELVRPDAKDGAKVHQSVVNAIINELDAKLSGQIDQILHHEELQKLESTWRSLKLLVDKTDFRENNKIEILNVSKSDLLEDFEDSPEVVKSGLYQHAYTSEYGTFGGEPVGLMVGNYEFDPGPQDMKLLQYTAAVSAMSHAPFISSVAPKFFGCESYTELPGLKDLSSIFEAPQYAKWRGFRESEDARYVGLTCPRFLLRVPYGSETVPVKDFNYEETVVGEHDTYLWGNSAFTMAANMTNAFAKYRFCTNIIGPQGGGAVHDLPIHTFDAMGAKQNKIPTEVSLSERREYELSEEGFMGLTFRKGSDNACFFSANSAQKAKTFGQSEEGKEAEANYRLGTQLPYMMMCNRLAHYLKVLQREAIGTDKSRVELERDLNKWIGQYVLAMDVADSRSKARRPLREAEVTVSDVAGEPGWYRVGLKVTPHFKYMGSFFTLSLVGKLDKN